MLTGINLKEVGALIFPTQAVRKLAGLPADAPMQQVLESAPVQAHFQQRARRARGQRAPAAPTASPAPHLMAEPPSIDKGEVTDKGSINQRAVLKHRAALVEALHAGTPALHRSNTAKETSSMKIEGQAALVTGGASGLGEATARELARLGAKVAVLDRQRRAGREGRAREIGGVACACDITDTDSVNAALDKAAAAHGPARILMNVAGIGSAKRIVGKDGSAGAAGRLRARGQRQPDRRLQHQPPVRGRLREAGARWKAASAA